MFFKRSLLKSVVLYTVYLKYLEETELKVLDNNQTGWETLMESLILYNTVLYLFFQTFLGEFSYSNDLLTK